MKKHFVATVLILIVLSLFISCKKEPEAKTVNYEEFLEFYDEGNYGIWSVTLKDEVRETITSVDIPATYKGKEVYEVYGFEKATNLESVTIPGTVEYINDGAFSECTKLKSIVIPKSVKGLGDCVFQDCTSLASVTFEEGSVLKWIGDNCFDSTNISSIKLPEGLQSIDTSVFRDCKNLTSIDIPNSLYEIGSSVCKNINANATITIHRVKDSIVIGTYHSWDAPSTVKFNWTDEKTTYTVTYNKNGADEGESYTTQVYEYGTEIEIAACPTGWKKEGFTFNGWNTDHRGWETSYSVGATYKGPTTTLYAQWVEDNK
jgi:hypothetical protein